MKSLLLSLNLQGETKQIIKPVQEEQCRKKAAILIEMMTSLYYLVIDISREVLNEITEVISKSILHGTGKETRCQLM